MGEMLKNIGAVFKTTPAVIVMLPEISFVFCIYVISFLMFG